MSKLSTLDLAFLALETTASPKHVAGLCVFELGPDRDRSDLNDLLLEMKSVAAAPPFNKKLDVSLTAMPRWVEDPDIDLEWHVRHLALPEPGGLDHLMQIVSQLHSTMLDRSRPLWEFYLIEGLEGGQFATYFKVHHAYMDGGSMSKRITGTLNEMADDSILTPIWGSKYTKPEITSEERSLLKQLIGGIKDAGTAIGSIPKLGGLAVEHGLKALGIKDGALPVPFAAPKTQLNEPVTAARGTAIAQLPLANVKQVATKAGVSINAVLLSVCDGALMAYLDKIGEMPDKPLIAQMPMSLRREGDSKTGNQITVALIELATGVRDPVERLKTISENAADVIGEFGKMSEFTATTYTILLQSLAQASEVTKVNRFLLPLGNVLISNVIGPKEPLYMSGSRLVGLYPISTIPPGVSSNITFYTTGGTVNIGVIAGREAVRDVPFVAEHMVKSFDELEHALLEKTPTKKTRKKKMSKKRVTKKKVSQTKAARKKAS